MEANPASHCTDTALHPCTCTVGYSGGGFLTLQLLLESLEGKPVAMIAEPFLRGSGTAVSLGLSFEQVLRCRRYR